MPTALPLRGYSTILHYNTDDCCTVVGLLQCYLLVRTAVALLLSVRSYFADLILAKKMAKMESGGLLRGPALDEVLALGVKLLTIKDSVQLEIQRANGDRTASSWGEEPALVLAHAALLGSAKQISEGSTKLVLVLKVNILIHCQNVLMGLRFGIAHSRSFRIPMYPPRWRSRSAACF